MSNPSAASYRTTLSARNRDTRAAQRLNDEGLLAVEAGKLDTAERHFRQALDEDLYYAPAHNNLGLVLLQTERYYDAAWEFEYAQKLAPTAPEPRDNLGLLYETLGRLGQAISQYEAAIEIEPDRMETMRQLARAYVKAGREDDELRDVLGSLLAVPQDRQWDMWIRGQIIRLGRPEEEDP